MQVPVDADVLSSLSFLSSIIIVREIPPALCHYHLGLGGVKMYIVVTELKVN